MAVRQSYSLETRDATLRLITERLRGFATYLGCGDDSDDVVQDTLLVLHLKYPEERHPEELIKIANRICVNIVRNFRRRRRGFEDCTQLQDLRDPRVTPEQMFAQTEFTEAVHHVIEKSDERCKAMLKLELQGADNAEICSRLGLKPETLYVARTRCYQRLRKILELIT
jgi:RNA polymerase sigma factor (sigma-70 family)